MAESGASRDQSLEKVLRTVRDLGLAEQLIELETAGYTVIRGVLGPDQIERARQSILRRVARDCGKRIDVDAESGANWTGQTYVPYLLYEDPVFEDILMAPKPLALHSDNGNGMPAPFSPISMVANVNYALTPYSREGGALAIVPGSHRLARQPTAREMRLDGERANPAALAMDLAPGDAVVWHGNTWHGSFARRIPGVRMNLAVYFNRQHIQTQELHRGMVPAEVLDRHCNDRRFAVLLGAKQPYGWRHEGPDYLLMARNPRGLYD